MAFKIKVAASAGFCFGVRKALDKLIDIRNNTSLPVRTLGPLIHNEQVLETLKKREVQELCENEDVADKHVVLRAHGVTPETRAMLLEKRALVCDATCPKVGQVQAIVKKYSRKNCPVVIIGDRGHAEVEGLLGYCPNTGLVVTGPEEALLLQEGNEVCVVAQTTQDPVIFNQTVSIIKKKFLICHEYNTVCDATIERQTETEALATESEIMVVVGGGNSANTKRLADIAGSKCKTIMIQSVADLKASDFYGVKKVGITAGASTPAWVIREVVERIRMMGWEQTGTASSVFYKWLIILTKHAVTWSLGLGMLTFALVYAITGITAWITASVVALLIWLWRILGHRLNPGLDTGVAALLVAISSIQIYKHSMSLSYTIISSVYMCVVVFNRLLLYDCLHVQADKISGHVTLPSMNREKLTHAVILTSIAAASIAAIALMVMKSSLSFSPLFLIPAGYILFMKRKMNKQGWCDLHDVLYLDAPVWLSSTLVILIQYMLQGNTGP